MATSTGDIWGSFDLSRVTLVDGHSVGTTLGHLSQVPGALSSSTKDAFHVQGTYGDQQATGIDATVVYQIVMLGAPTGYWISTRLHEQGGSPRGSCIVYLGEPQAGGNVADPSPFTCDTSNTQGFPNGRFTFAVALNRAAEAAGVILTQGPVSLTAGHFESNNLPYLVPGSNEVGLNGSTRFETVFRDGDEPTPDRLARTEFAYRIVDAGKQTTFWIAGWSQNYRGTTKFTPEAKCFVYDVDPVTSADSLESLKPVSVSPYTCEKTSEQFIGYRGNYEATFTVARRKMTLITQPLLQKELVERVCTHTDNCGLSLATVTDTYAPGKQVSSIVNNPTDVMITPSITTSGSQSITNSGGFEIDLAVEGGIGVKYTATLKVHYERSVTTTTTTSETIPIPVPPHSKGWLEGTPPMVHTEGLIIVHDGDRYFELANVVAEFPVANGKWEYTVVTHTLSPPLGEEPNGEDPDGENPPVSDSPSTANSDGVEPSATSGSTHLAATGASFDGATPMVAIAAALLGGGFLLIRRRRRHDME